jgi:hypothetical protein
MSHMKGGAGGGAVCLRSKARPTEQHLAILGVQSARSVSNEAFCAAHLAYLSQIAYDEYAKDPELGLMLPYTGRLLCGAVGGWTQVLFLKNLVLLILTTSTYLLIKPPPPNQHKYPPTPPSTRPAGPDASEAAGSALPQPGGL